MREPFRVMIVDDHALAREGIREIFEGQSQFQIVGEANNGLQAMDMTQQLMPDIILMDINMPVMGGVEATERIKERFPLIKIVMVTVSEGSPDLFKALEKGAQGYLFKNSDSSAWIDYLRVVAQDENP